MKQHQSKTNKNYKNKNQTGSVLVTLLVFTAVAITVTTGAIIVSAINTQGISAAAQSTTVLHNVNGAGELSALAILRNPDYTGETITIQGNTVTISTSGSTTKTSDVYNTSNSIVRKLQIIGDYTNNTYNITSWKETP